MASAETGTERRFFTIGTVVRLTNTPASTLRSWEERGLIPVPDRVGGRDMRLYDNAAVEAIRKLRNLPGVSEEAV